MKLQVKPVEEIVRLALQKAMQRSADPKAQGSPKTIPVFLPGRFLPPTRKSYRWERYVSEYGEISLLSIPRENGWIVKVKFPFAVVQNPAVDPKVGQQILQNLQKRN